MVETLTATDERAADRTASGITSSMPGERQINDAPTTGEVMRVVAEWINNPNAQTTLSSREYIKRYLARHPDDNVMASRLRAIEEYAESNTPPPSSLGALDEALQITVEKSVPRSSSDPIDHPDLIVIGEVNQLIREGQYQRALDEISALSQEACDLRLSALERIHDGLSYDPASMTEPLHDEISNASGDVTNRALDACKAPTGDTYRVIDAWYITKRDIDYGRAQAMIALSDHDDTAKAALRERLARDRSEHIRRSELFTA